MVSRRVRISGKGNRGRKMALAAKQAQEMLEDGQ